MKGSRFIPQDEIVAAAKNVEGLSPEDAAKLPGPASPSAALLSVCSILWHPVRACSKSDCHPGVAREPAHPEFELGRRSNGT